MNIKIPAAVFASFCAAWVLASNTTQTTAAAKPTPCPVVPTAMPVAAPDAAKAGETIVTKNYRFSVVAVERGKIYGSISRPQNSKENEFIAVDVLIESLANEGIYAGSTFAKVRDSSGYEYSSTLFGKDPSLKDQNDVPAGQKRRGWITFEVPKKATGLVLSYGFGFSDEHVEVILGN